jgi:hypothetical protein
MHLIRRFLGAQAAPLALGFEASAGRLGRIAHRSAPLRIMSA